jgi:two-component system chemotaxis sensor kinase CheA
MIFTAVCALIFLSILVSVYLLVVTIERCRSEKRFNFIYCLMGLFFYNLGYLVEVTCGSTEAGVIAIKLMYIGACFMPPFFFFFIADYCELKIKPLFYKIPLLAIAVFDYLLVATFDHHTLIYSGYYYNHAEPLKGIEISPGPLYSLATIFSFLCVIVTCAVLVKRLIETKNGRRTLVLLLIASAAPIFAQLFYVFLSFIATGPLAGINFTAFVFVISNIILYVTVLKSDLFDLAPKAYSITIDLIRDAFVVLDKDMNYIGCNRNARLLFPDLETFPKGKEIFGLENWPEELGAPDTSRAANAEPDARAEKNFTLPQRPNHNYSGWMNAVAKEDGSVAGWVVLIQDITEMVNLINNIQAQRDEIAAMRDNLKEGLFLMDRNCTIQPSYSKALEDVLSCTNIQGKNFLDILRQSFSAKDIETIRDYFDMIFEGSMEVEELEDLNPLREFGYTSVETGGKKTLRGLFAAVDRGKGDVLLLGTFQDITAETELKKQLSEEESMRQDEMQTVFELLQVEPGIFNSFIEDADYEFNRINETLKEKKIPSRDAVANIYQSVHAIKSNALIVGLGSFGKKLHRLETDLKELREKQQISFDDILHVTVELDKRMKDRDKFLDIIKRIKDFTTGKGRNEQKSEREIFIETLSMACRRASSDLGKKVRFTADSFDKAALDGKERGVMKEILTQLVRNSVYHGIESPEERIKKGKKETGDISLSVSLENGAIRMILKDDGQGLDFSKIAEKASALGLIKNGETAADKKLLLKAIFSPGFSTSETENLHAGRGMGLNLVSERLKEVHGNIRLQNVKGGGLLFDIRIPRSAA